ncbi:MAG TPA: hypothetical protein DE315_02925 [Candidatus Omnitrophica bacterium]|nr:hypothetical protein [Candidatus Omnitrophota bacterium]HCI44474.1 hypothetical protein [Candidatus Omnitrophota bacterium]
MLALLLLFAYLCVVFFVIGLIPVEWEKRPKLALAPADAGGSRKKKTVMAHFRKLAMVNKPLCAGAIRQRLVKDLAMARVDMAPEEFILVKEVLAGLFLFITFPSVKPDQIFFWLCMGFTSGYLLPEFWVKGKIKRIKAVIVKELPDAIDLLGLCVNAGLDFMLSLKWVVEKSPPSVMVEELNTVLQEINVGKTRRDAIKDLAAKYELPDLSTFARTLIQADKMGTSVTEALNILSEDMRLARYRRGETLALKAPMKMLVPLLVFIFPVVGILVAGPILLDFMENNPFQNLTGR